jgi:hypothetical protein
MHLSTSRSAHCWSLSPWEVHLNWLNIHRNCLPGSRSCQTRKLGLGTCIDNVLCYTELGINKKGFIPPGFSDYIFSCIFSSWKNFSKTHRICDQKEISSTALPQLVQRAYPSGQTHQSDPRTLTPKPLSISPSAKIIQSSSTYRRSSVTARKKRKDDGGFRVGHARYPAVQGPTARWFA